LKKLPPKRLPQPKWLLKKRLRLRKWLRLLPLRKLP
jgi:hypothetical protein